LEIELEHRRGNAMKLVRHLVCAGALAIVSTYALAKPAYVLTTVNLRSGAGTNNEIVTKIPAGSLIEVNTCTNGWCEASWQGKNGFAIETALDTSGRVPPRRPAYAPGPTYSGPPVYSAPPAYYGPPAYYYSPGPYYYDRGPYYYGRPYWRRRYWY
jgi:uncharacterized protein YraI